MGWIRLRTQRGVTMTGSRSVRYRSISKLAEPEPMITAARNTTAGVGASSRIWPTSAREARWRDNSWPLGVMPPRYTDLVRPARADSAATRRAASRSTCSKSARPREWTR